MRTQYLPVAVATLLLAAACSPDHAAPPTAPGAAPDLAMATLDGPTYMVLGRNGKLPSDFAAQMATAGGSISSSLPEIGAAFVRSSAPDFATRVATHSGIESVTPDMMLQWVDPDPSVVAPVDAGEQAAPPSATVASLGDDETFYSFQWAPAAVQAPEAWNAGWTGRGVRVAILDGAIYNSHLDLAPNLDVAASRSFVPGVAYNQDGGTFWHGTHVAGIVAAADNGIGTVGIAPNATLIGVKVLHNGSGAWEWVLNGIVYAARPIAEGGAGANIINMSLGGTFQVTNENRADFREFKKVMDRATEYAYKKDVTVITSAGNGSTNFDLAKDLFKMPTENANVLGISATGPIGWARGSSDFSTLAYYSDHGKSLVEVAAPGGNAALLVVHGDASNCTVAGTFLTITIPCYVFDMVMSTVRGGTTASYGWAQGTSMAAPLATGVVALMMERHGRLTPAQVKAKLRQSSVDLGIPGNDEIYGHGWVNAWRAVR